jgi:curved DNA-binding protein CbpA
VPLASPLPPSSTSHYALLQVAETASPQELRQAFRGLSKLYHPDTTLLPEPEAAALFQLLQQAYAVLSDPELRRRYDAELHPVLPQSPPPLAAMAANGARRVSVRRDLSGGEWLALLLLGFALVVSLVLGVGVAWMRGVELVELPSWWVGSAARAGLAP